MRIFIQLSFILLGISSRRDTGPEVFEATFWDAPDGEMFTITINKDTARALGLLIGERIYVYPRRSDWGSEPETVSDDDQS
jgi:hypothetical protein